mgnify:CR=1 FL=1
MLSIADLKIAVSGLGCVGLPLAVEFRNNAPVGGVNIYQKRINAFKSGQDHTLEVSPEELKQANQLSYSAKLEDLKNYNASILFLSMVNQLVDEMSQHKSSYSLHTQISLLLQR